MKCLQVRECLPRLRVRHVSLFQSELVFNAKTNSRLSSPAHNYTYPFEPNPNWSSFYAFGPEIKQYFEDFAKKYDLMRYVKLNSKVLSATWDESTGICMFSLRLHTKICNANQSSSDNVQIESEGKVIDDWCHVLVNGTGFLNSWKCNLIGSHIASGCMLTISRAKDPRTP